jgi:hypothetical protein
MLMCCGAVTFILLGRTSLASAAYTQDLHIHSALLLAYPALACHRGTTGNRLPKPGKSLVQLLHVCPSAWDWSLC